MENMDEQPLMVSIRCTAYNHESYIRQCLEGFVMQKTNFRFEAIVHDDASTDGTAAIIREYAEKYPDIIKPIYETENQYSTRNLTRIMDEHTHGKYVAICEGDDYWIDPLKLQKQVDFLENNPDVSLVFSNRVVFNELTNTKHNLCYNKRYYTSKDLLGGEILGIQTVCCRRECLTSNASINGDILIPYNSSLHGKLYCLPDITAVYRISGKGVATSVKIDEVLAISLRHAWNFHEVYNFPSMHLLIKFQTRYVFNDLVRKIKARDYTLAKTIKSFSFYHNQSLVKKTYALILMNYYILSFFINSLYEKIKR